MEVVRFSSAIMDVNTKGMWLGMQETARQMIEQGPQEHPYKMICVGSVAGPFGVVTT